MIDRAVSIFTQLTLGMFLNQGSMHTSVSHLAIVPVDEQRLGLDLVRIWPALPVFQRPYDDELGWSFSVSVSL